MTLDEASRLFEYDDWANIKLLAMLSNIFGEETDLSANADSRISSLRKTALHMVAGSAFWRTRIQPDARSEKISSEEYTTVLEIGFAFRAESARLHGLLETFKDDEKLHETLKFQDFDGDMHSLRLDQILTHLSMHFVYHRGQITGILIDLGFDKFVESTDILYFYKQMNL